MVFRSKGGDELNLIEKGANYGWPEVSNGDNYDGSPIPDHDTRPEFAAPKLWWNPSISPAGLVIYCRPIDCDRADSEASQDPSWLILRTKADLGWAAIDPTELAGSAHDGTGIDEVAAAVAARLAEAVDADQAAALLLLPRHRAGSATAERPVRPGPYGRPVRVPDRPQGRRIVHGRRQAGEGQHPGGRVERRRHPLRQAVGRQRGLSRRVAAGDAVKAQKISHDIDAHETHVVPIIADIDAGFGNAEATYLLARKFIEAGACCIQIENQVSDEKQCGHQDGKVTVPHEDFHQKIRAIRYAFMEMGVEDGIIVARTDSLGAGLTKQIAYSTEPGDLGDQYNAFLDCDEVDPANITNGQVFISRDGKLMTPKRLPSNLYQFRSGTGEDRCVLDCITALQNGADLLWIETEKPHIEQIAGMVDRIRAVVPDAKLVYNNSPSFNWTMKFREQVLEDWKAAGKDVSSYPEDGQGLMAVELDESELALEADQLIQSFQADSARDAGIFHHLITLPTYHETALGVDTLSEGYFGDSGMLAYVKGVQRMEIRRNMNVVKHQEMAGTTMGDHHKEYFAGENALLAGGKDNTMNQF